MQKHSPEVPRRSHASITRQWRLYTSRMNTDSARFGLLWTSAVAMALASLSLPNIDSGSILEGVRRRLSLDYTDRISCPLFLALFTAAALAYAIASHSIYLQTKKRASVAIIGSLGMLACQMIFAPSMMGGAERLLVLLPLSLSVGLSWADHAVHAEQGRISPPPEKS